MNHDTLAEELREREFNKVVDQYILTGKLSPDLYESCTISQKLVIQCLKRSFKRIIQK